MFSISAFAIVPPSSNSYLFEPIKIFSEEECIAIYEEYKEVGRINILAEKYNVSRCTISSLLKELDPGYERFYKRGKFTKEEEKEIYEFYKINGNIKQTAKKLKNFLKPPLKRLTSAKKNCIVKKKSNRGASDMINVGRDF